MAFTHWGATKYWHITPIGNVLNFSPNTALVVSNFLQTSTLVLIFKSGFLTTTPSRVSLMVCLIFLILQYLRIHQAFGPHRFVYSDHNIWLNCPMKLSFHFAYYLQKEVKDLPLHQTYPLRDFHYSFLMMILVRNYLPFTNRGVIATNITEITKQMCMYSHKDTWMGNCGPY